MKKKHPHIFRYIILLLLIGVVAVCIWPLISHGHTPKEDELASRTKRLTIMTWNTHQLGQFRKPKDNEVLQYLLEQDADVICLQEVDVYKRSEFLTLPEVNQVLGSKYPYSYIDFSVYNKRRQFGNMVWSRYPLIHKKTVDYEIRANLSSRCDMIVGMDTFRLIVNHLESNRFSATDIVRMDSASHYEDLRHSAQQLSRKWTIASTRRHEQARAVRKEIEASPYPVIVVGDLNDIALSYTYYTIAKDLHDAWLETSWGKWGATFDLKGIGVRIDYIFCQDPLVPVGCTVHKATGSDHWPVEAILAW